MHLLVTIDQLNARHDACELGIAFEQGQDLSEEAGSVLVICIEKANRPT